MSLPALMYLSVIFLAFTLQLPTGKPIPNYSLDEGVIRIDCGSSGRNTAPGDNHLWDGDVGSILYFPLQSRNSTSSVASELVEPLSSTPGDVPYRTARFSLSEFTYSIHVKPGAKFIRLYFYSAKYNNFDSFNASFSVKAGQYTLLSNFSVSLTADALGRKYLVKEFCFAVEKSSRNIMFSPSSSISGALAFINGIEIIPMPSDLYYPENQERGIKFVGEENHLYPLGIKKIVHKIRKGQTINTTIIIYAFQITFEMLIPIQPGMYMIK